MTKLHPLISGRTAVSGRVSGRVKIILTSDDADSVKDGDVLVTPMTDPDMVPAIQRAAAVVTDRGGMLCHAAIVCRELGKPCIVGTGNASTTLRNHTNVLVDANSRAGTVSIFNDEEVIE
jgi:pyruvate,water dikinase